MKTDRRFRTRHAWALATAVFAVAACAEGDSMDAPEGSDAALTDNPPAASETPPAATETAPVVVEAGTSMVFRVGETVSTESHSVGDNFTAALQTDINANDGSVGLPAGTLSRWVVTESTSDGADGQALLAFRLESVQRAGEWHPIESTVTETEIRTDERDSNTETAAKVAVGAAAGAIIGQIIGRDSESTLTGAGVGAAVGTVVALTTRGGSAEMAEGSTMTVRLDEALTVGY